MELNPGNKKPYDTLWALLSIDKNGNEGIVALNTPIGPQVAVTGEERMMAIYIEAAVVGRAEANNSGMRIVIGEFKRIRTKGLESHD